MNQPSVTIIDTAVANIASMQAAWNRLGYRPVLTTDGNEVLDANLVVLPGVGAFASGMARLRELQLDSVLIQRSAENRPLLAVCLGLQLLCSESEEAPGVAGLGIIPKPVRRLPGIVPVPQLGWNQVVPSPSADGGNSAKLTTGYAYFANSFCLSDAPDGWAYANTNYGFDFVSAAARGRILACQFHPELSGAWGLQTLREWAQLCTGASNG